MVNNEKKTVWVLTISMDGEVFPEVHSTFRGAVDGAIEDLKAIEGLKECKGNESDYDLAAIRKELEEQTWYKGLSGATYDITECVVWG